MKTRLKKLFWEFFPPDSRADRFLRRIYHFFPSLPHFTEKKLRASFVSYPRWLEQHEQNIKLLSGNHGNDARVSFLLPFNPENMGQGISTIKSLLAQSIPDWELILSLPIETSKPGWLTQEIYKDPRIKIIYQQVASIKKMLVPGTGDYLVCCWPGDQFSTSFLQLFFQQLQSNRDSVVFYADCDALTGNTARPVPLFKPHHHSPELLLSKNFLSRSFIKNEIALQHLSDVGEENEFLVQEWELLIRISENHTKITHMPYTLIHQVEPQQLDHNQVNHILTSHITRLGYSGVTVKRKEQCIDITWEFPPPRISIIIPTKNNYRELRILLDSLFELTSYPPFEVILVDNQSDSPQILAYYESLSEMDRARIIPFAEKFNFSRANNLGASWANGNLLLFMNNDMQIIQRDWLSELAQWALMPEIGIVGAKLLFPNLSIQHAGVVLGMQGIAGHVYQNAPQDFRGLIGSVNWYRNFSAVTGACQMMRKDVFNELGGFDETFQLTFSDIDLCLRAIKKSYRILYNPNAVLVHHQGKTRGYYNPEEDILLSNDKMKGWIEKNDPYFSPNLTYSAIPGCRFN